MPRESYKHALETISHYAGRALMLFGIIYLAQLGPLSPQPARADGPQDVKVVNHIEPDVYWSPDSDRFAYFCSVWRNPQQLCITDLQGNIYSSPAEMPVDTSKAPTWAPDGEHIVYACRNDQDPIEGIKWMNCMADKKMENVVTKRVFLHPELVPTATVVPATPAPSPTNDKR